MNVVLACYFNSQVDNQRGIYWNGDESELATLRESVKRNKQKLIIFSDCFEGKDIISHYPSRSPYIERWIVYRDYLVENKNIHKVYCVDATDTEMLKNPFIDMEEGRVYIGDENQKIGTPWMLENHPEPFMVDFFRGKAHRMLNVGILGGYRETLVNLFDTFSSYAERYSDIGNTEMGLFNYLLYTKYKGVVTHGSPINTVFKAFDYDNKECLWRHK